MTCLCSNVAVLACVGVDDGMPFALGADLPGIVSDEPQLRTMLAHLTKTLHPGVLNDCFFDAATAVCVKRATVLGRPVPQHNMCLRCPNARRSSVHRPRLVAARSRCEMPNWTTSSADTPAMTPA
ncbi:hypothetical protein [Acrocarpospora catenulata]|uniref:hypothetical protein n=1 Tax=Acrocarpospora catenulata TaxID=2836182 RepID=UPI001BD93A1A|nr:hypothetical protein [Acrocarpospora catenulata]